MADEVLQRLTDWKKSPVLRCINGLRAKWNIHKLNDEDWNVRYWAAKTLSAVSGARAVPYLIDVLKDKSEEVRGTAAWELGNIGDARAIPHLIFALKDSTYSVRSAAAMALGEIGEPAVPALIDALKDEDSEVRFRAADALRNIAEKGADINSTIPHLFFALNDDARGVRVYATWALKGIINNYKSVEESDTVQKALENEYEEWKKKQPQGSSKEKSERQVEISEIMIFISKRKAELARMDGELLLGDTVKKPEKGGKKIYRIGKATC